MQQNALVYFIFYLLFSHWYYIYLKGFSLAYFITSIFDVFQQVDPFLQLVDDRKLQAVKNEFGRAGKVYGSKEDDEDALKSLSAIKTAGEQSRESFATTIVKNLGKSSDVKSNYSCFKHCILCD